MPAEEPLLKVKSPSRGSGLIHIYVRYVYAQIRTIPADSQLPGSHSPCSSLLTDSRRSPWQWL